MEKPDNFLFPRERMDTYWLAQEMSGLIGRLDCGGRVKDAAWKVVEALAAAAHDGGGPSDLVRAREGLDVLVERLDRVAAAERLSIESYMRVHRYVEVMRERLRALARLPVDRWHEVGPPVAGPMARMKEIQERLADVKPERGRKPRC